MQSSRATFQQKKIQEMMLQGAWMLIGEVQIVFGFKDLHSYGKKINIGQIKMNQWQQMIQNWKGKPNHLLQLSSRKTSLGI